jgi:transcription elongation factor GreB
MTKRPMTREGFDLIEAEIERLWHEERPMVVKEVTAAAELGDRSENAAYIYGKKRLRAIDGRLRYLRRKIDTVQPVVLANMPHNDRVKWGAIVDLEDEDGNTRTYRLIDKEESEPSQGRISVQSPIGRALLGKVEGDVVTVVRPIGDVEYEILAVRYGGGEP